MTEHVCEQCCEAVSTNAKNCPHCGYDAGESHRKSGGQLMGAGALLCFTVIGLPLGIPIFAWGYRRRQRGEAATVAVDP